MFKWKLESKLLAAALTILIVLPPELLAIKLAAVRGSYGALLFLGIPFSLGFVSVLIYEKLAGPSAKGGLAVALLATALCGSFLLIVGWEGIICMMIVFIIATPFSLLGAGAALALLRLRRRQTMAACLVLAMPFLAPQERRWHVGAEPFVVQTSIEIAASPDKVWPYVVQFPLISAPPDSALLRAGVAYPVRTQISGSGTGVTRECIFTTGTAKEIVDVWDQPHRLHFIVLSQPPLMQETSWVPDLQTEHVKSEYVRSREGQFDLIALPNGHTLVTGTSWYELKYWPSSYWHLWTDAIVHSIHRRVLNHIKSEVESGQRG